MPPKRAKWNEEALRAAMAAVERGQLSQRAAADRHGIPRRTLRNHLKSGSRLKRLGRRSIMTENQEQDFVHRIIRFANIGMPLTPKMIRKQAFVFCETNNILHNFNGETRIAGKDWLKMFLNRNSILSKRKAQVMNPARAQKLNRAIVSQHFEELKKLYEELDIQNNPERLYNMDEKGCRLTVHRQQTVLAQKGARRVHLIAQEHAENVTIAMCVNAVGSAIPPMIIFKGQRQKPEYEDNLPPGSLVKMAPKGSMTTSLFIEFIHHLGRFKTQGKTLLIFDGASSHLDYTIVEAADQNNIVLYCLPSNTTHELQPLDKSVNKAFEHHWDQEVLTFMYQKPDRRLTKTSFNHLFSKAWSKSLTNENIINGFRATGLFPFNPDVLPDEAYAPSILTELPPPQDTVTSAPDVDNHNASMISEPLSPDLAVSPSILIPRQQYEKNPLDYTQSHDVQNDYVTPIHSPLPSTSGLQRKLPTIYSSDSETDCEINAEQLKKLTFYRKPRNFVYTSSEEEKSDPEDEVPLSNLKPKELQPRLQHPLPVSKPDEPENVKPKKSQFHELMPTPNYAVVKEKPRRKAINYKGQRVTKDLFKDQREMKENKKAKQLNANSTKAAGNQKIDVSKNKGKGKGKKSKVVPESSWYCHACKESTLSDMRQCVQCVKWYHEECVGLSSEDKEAFYCPFCT